MTWTRKNQITTALFVAGILLLLGLAAASIVFGLRTVDRNARLGELRREYELSHGILQGLTDAETGVRGYVITADPGYLEPYYAGLRHIELQIDEAKQDRESLLFGQDAPTTKDLASLIVDRQRVMANLIAVMHRDGTVMAQQVLAKGEGKRVMDEVRHQMVLIDQKVTAESARIADEVETSTRLLSGMLTGSILLAILMSIAQFWLFRREIRQRGQVEVDLQVQHRQVALLARLADSLHASNSRTESYHVIEAFAREILGGIDGCLYVYNHSRDQLVRAAMWGGENIAHGLDHFMPDDCWGLRRGKLHMGSTITGQIDCTHFRKDDEKHPYICLPITARGQTSGLLYLESPAFLRADTRTPVVELATNFVDQLSLALVNIELRERLENMAIRDALTELYNRRFMDEALARELLLAQRNNTQLSIALMDIDHFKKMNDTYGHQAGDEVLRQVAKYLSAAIRRSDFVCRYGGEELMLLLPGCDLAQALAKANEVREGIAQLPLSAGGLLLPNITISIGVATHPMHGMNPADLLSQADQALYDAKRGGRNMVIAAPHLPQAAK